MAPGLSIQGVRGKERCGSSLGIFIRPSPELSIRDVGEAAGVEMRMSPGLSVGGVGGSVRSTSYNGLSIRLYP